MMLILRVISAIYAVYKYLKYLKEGLYMLKTICIAVRKLVLSKIELLLYCAGLLLSNFPSMSHSIEILPSSLDYNSQTDVLRDIINASQRVAMLNVDQCAAFDAV